MSEQMEVIVSPAGKVMLTIKGVSGKACLELTERIEAVLGEVERRELGPEYYESPNRAEVSPILRNILSEDE
jgi:hypothetical protein